MTVNFELYEIENFINLLIIYKGIDNALEELSILAEDDTKYTHLLEKYEQLTKKEQEKFNLLAEKAIKKYNCYGNNDFLLKSFSDFM